MSKEWITKFQEQILEDIASMDNSDSNHVIQNGVLGHFEYKDETKKEVIFVKDFKDNANIRKRKTMKNLHVEDSFFDVKMLTARLEKIKKMNISYAIGVDTSDENCMAYCLSKIIDDRHEILLIKTMSNKNEFNQEVENLSKYFNAVILKDVKDAKQFYNT
jgi:hypothetical protein